MGCSSTKRAKTGAAIICKIALHTVPRCGAAALVLLGLGLYLIFPGFRVWQQLREDKGMPRVLEAATDRETVDLNNLAKIDAVAQVTPVISISGELSTEEAKLNCEIQCVYASWLGGNFSRGGVFPDGSVMPFLALNQAAAEAFLQEDERYITVDAGTDILLTAQGSSQKAQVCGILRDESETPAVYMSYDTARRIFAQNDGSAFLLRLNRRGDSEAVVKALRRMGFSAGTPENEALRWKLMEQQSLLFLFAGAGSLILSVLLTREHRKGESEGERQALLLSGMTAAQANGILPLRALFTNGLALFLAAILAAAVGNFTASGFAAAGILACLHFAGTMSGSIRLSG